MNTETQIATLKAARELISVPGNWNKRAFALDWNRNWCDPRSPEACSWCIDGALQAVVASWGEDGNDETIVLHYLLMDAAEDEGYPDYPSFNDDPDTTHGDVMKFLDGVIAELEQAS